LVSHRINVGVTPRPCRYDFAHCISDAIEGITHSLCTLEFEDHRPLYDWVLDELQDSGLISARPRQTEFSRLNLQYTVLSKRKLIQLVEGKHVHGWDDPRMPTIAGIRRRGVTPAALRLFCERVGISKVRPCPLFCTNGNARPCLVLATALSNGASPFPGRQQHRHVGPRGLLARGTRG